MALRHPTASLIGVLLVFGCGPRMEVGYEPSPMPVVRAMLELADVGADDVVYDLGSGDGRIPITAAREFGARGVGIEIDPELVSLARTNAREAGIEDQVEFRLGDLYEADVRPATVVTLFLHPGPNLKLRPKLLSQLEPGSRVVSYIWDMGDWRLDAGRTVDGRRISLWRIPQDGSRLHAPPPSPARRPATFGPVPVLARRTRAGSPTGQALEDRPCWTIQTATSHLVIHVKSSGLLSPVLHDHHFVPAQWAGHICFDPATPEDLGVGLTIQAASLENRQPELSADDLATVERQVKGPEILHVDEHPVVQFEGDELSIEQSSPGFASGTVAGRLTLRGVTNELGVPVTARWDEAHLRAAGTVAFKQSAFGIRPYRRYLGTVRVKDEVTVEFVVEAAR